MTSKYVGRSTDYGYRVAEITCKECEEKMLYLLKDRLTEEGWQASLLTSNTLLVTVADREEYSILMADYKRIKRELKDSRKATTNDKIFEEAKRIMQITGKQAGPCVYEAMYAYKTILPNNVYCELINKLMFHDK